MTDQTTPSSLLRQEGPQQERNTDLIARLRDYHDQVLQGFRHISRVEEADLIQAAIDGLRQKEQKKTKTKISRA